eukprot:CAMPEP_0171355232 /NCGR_PEP_ID=MMETSP0878-20121228/45112_1 /TAXON_ID=67004 /ORGANISM="Thalassiosira weissflogii, Strain CCMP1336" /LENGTH=1224 /DNA_ID=CAMNT_0011861225 /DNA_START=2051 /DNA_END=5728 /DNA_ORIENTATION=+
MVRLQLATTFLLFHQTRSVSSQSSETIRSFSFNVKPTHVPLADLLPPHTIINRLWPRDELRTEAPGVLPAVAVHQDGVNVTSLMGPPIHVQSGDRIKLKLTNEVPFTGLSIHCHGFHLNGEFEYDGAVGIAQCPLSDGNSFTYDILAIETPGTYWYHTQSGHMGIDSYDAVRGPLIVHPNGTDFRLLVDKLNDVPNDLPDDSPVAYESERILFFQDVFLLSQQQRYAQHIGNLYGPASNNEDGFIAATTPWEFGTCNGKLREIITVLPNRKYKFRLINGGLHHALRISIDSFPMTVVAADSEPVEPYKVDEVVLHVGERFDVEIIVYNDIAESERFWIRADTLESQSQGFQNGVRAILRVSSVPSALKDYDVLDPPNLSLYPKRTEDTGWKTLNCHSEDKLSGCVPITALTHAGIDGEMSLQLESEIHTVATHFQPTPQYGHFLSVDQANFKQNEFPPVSMISHHFRTPENSLHPNSVAMGVSRASSVIIVWSTSLLMDHPIHLHGHKVEILDISYPTRQKDCTLSYCMFSDAYIDLDRIKALDRTPLNVAVKKDTFIIPAGGAIVTRFQTYNRGLWLVNAQLDIHSEDGLSFLLNVGDYRVPKFDNWLPKDFPSCNTTLMKSMKFQPECECYVDSTAPLMLNLNSGYYCSRDHLCRHKRSQVANLDSYKYQKGFHFQSPNRLPVPEIILTTVFMTMVFSTLTLLLTLKSSRTTQPRGNGGRFSQLLGRLTFGSMASSRIRNSQLSQSTVDVTVTRCDQSDSHIRPSSVSENTRENNGKGRCNKDEIGSVSESEASKAKDSLCEELPPPPPPSSSTRPSSHIGDIMIQQPSIYSRQPSMSHRKSSITSVRNFYRRVNPSFMTRRSTLSTTFDRLFSERGSANSQMDEEDKNHVFVMSGLDGYHMRGHIDVVPVNLIVHRGSPLFDQWFHLFPMQWRAYLRFCANPMRLLEVVGLALVTGGIYSDIPATSRGVSQIYSLVLVTTTVWSFSRLYPAVSSHHEWFQSANILFKYKRFSLMPVYSARLVTVLLLECIWPTVYTFICFPVVGLAGDLKSLCSISFLLAANNLCYLSLGATLGSLAQHVAYGMSAATIVSQGSVVASGFFTSLPPSIDWVKYCSPFYWTMQGIFKSIFRWSDSLDCVSGSSSSVGSNQCFLEYDFIIDDLKKRGIYIASFNVDSSDNIFTAAIALVAITVFLHVVLFLRCFFAYYRVNWEEVTRRSIHHQ